MYKTMPEPYDDYEVSHLGDVRKISTGRRLIPYQRPIGYVTVSLLTGIYGVKQLHYLHRLVALLHVAGDTSLTVNHKDGVKWHNWADNLEWVTLSQNHVHRYRVLGQKPPEGAPRRAITGKSVTGPEVLHFRSINDAGRHFGHHTKAANIHNAVTTGQPAYGYTWSDAASGWDVV